MLSKYFYISKVIILYNYIDKGIKFLIEFARDKNGKKH